MKAVTSRVAAFIFRSRGYNTPRGILPDTVNAIHMAGGHLDRASDAADNHKIVSEISAEQKSLDTFLSKPAEVRGIADDGSFAEAAGGLKLQAESLMSVAEQIKKAASHTNAPNLVSSVYMEQATNYITLTQGTSAKLP